MNYWEICISLPREKVDLVSTFLVAEGYDTFQVEDYSDLLVNAGEMFSDYIEDDLLAKENTPPSIHLYFGEEETAAVKSLKKSLCQFVAQNAWTDVAVKSTFVENSDWDTRWKEYFQPFCVGDFLCVKPGWETEEKFDSSGRKEIVIDPGAAFGTGTHATTYLCLDRLEKYLHSGDRVLDMGCGSGILGIGAKKLGAKEVISVDIDPDAVRIAKENFIKNNCLGSDLFLCGNAIEDSFVRAQIGQGFDLVLANIVAGIIEEMAKILFDCLRSGGVLLASGILKTRRGEVLDHLAAAGFEMVEEKSREDWLCLVMKKP